MGEEKKASPAPGGEGGVEENKENEADNNNNNNIDDLIVIKVDTHCHCEACAKKIFRALRAYQGVEDVKVDRKTNTVSVKGKTADPLKICERIRHKTGRNTQLLSPLPKPPEDKPKDEDKKDEPQAPLPKADQPPPVVTVVLGVNMHCEACAQLLQKRIRNIKGVESVETDLGKGQVIVKGVIRDPEVLVKYVHKRTRKQVSIVKQEDDNKQEENTTTSTSTEQEDNNKGEVVDKNENKAGGITIIDQGKMINMTGTSNDYYWPSARYDYVEHNNDHHINGNYEPQIFSDENPNACSIM